MKFKSSGLLSLLFINNISAHVFLSGQSTMGVEYMLRANDTAEEDQFTVTSPAQYRWKTHVIFSSFAPDKKPQGIYTWIDTLIDIDGYTSSDGTVKMGGQNVTLNTLNLYNSYIGYHTNTTEFTIGKQNALTYDWVAKLNDAMPYVLSLGVNPPFSTARSQTARLTHQIGKTTLGLEGEFDGSADYDFYELALQYATNDLYLALSHQHNVGEDSTEFENRSTDAMAVKYGFSHYANQTLKPLEVFVTYAHYSGKAQPYGSAESHSVGLNYLNTSFLYQTAVEKDTTSYAISQVFPMSEKVYLGLVAKYGDDGYSIEDGSSTSTQEKSSYYAVGYIHKDF